MKQRIAEISVRNRIIIISSIISGIFFLFTTPILSWLFALVTRPPELQNIRVIASSTTLTVTWDPVTEIDVKSIAIEFNDQSYELESDEIRFNRAVNGEIPENITFKVRDNFGATNFTEVDLSEFGEVDLVDEIFNDSNNDSRANSIVFNRSLFLGVIIIVGTFFVLGFSLSSRKTAVLGLYPAFVIVPYLFLTYSFLIAETFEINKLILSTIFSLVLYAISYFVILTTNILNTSLSIKIPLEQAARASQFIFSLISSYIILILFFGVTFNFFEKILLIIPPIFYLTFSAILMLENMKFNQAIIRSLSITLTLIYGIFVLSIWPINYVYAILAIAVCFYILLSVALEIRPKLNNYVWVEYGVLISLITFLLILNSSWGINGTII